MLYRIRNLKRVPWGQALSKLEGKLIIKIKNKEEVIIDNKKWHMWRSSCIKVNLKHEKGTCKYVSKCWGENLSH